jgi:antirestriction protein
MIYQSVDVEPALYVGTYAKYNDGNIYGRWLKLAEYDGPEAFLQACRELHQDEVDPEFMFQDYEGFPRDLYSESLSLVDLERIYEWVRLSGEDRDMVAAYLDATGAGIAEVDVEDVRASLFCVLDDPWMPDQETAVGRYLIDESLVEVPDHLQGYIDEARLGRDWLMDMHVSSNGYVFEA